jgi:hypothetical protein
MYDTNEQCFSYIKERTSYNQWDHVPFLIGSLQCYLTEQQSVVRYVAPFGYIILIPSQQSHYPYSLKQLA